MNRIRKLTDEYTGKGAIKRLGAFFSSPQAQAAKALTMAIEVAADMAELLERAVKALEKMASIEHDDDQRAAAEARAKRRAELEAQIQALGGDDDEPSEAPNP